MESNITEKSLPATSEEWGKLERFWRERVTQEGALGGIKCEGKEAAGFAHWLPYLPAGFPNYIPLLKEMISRLTDQEHTWESGRILEYLCGQSVDYPIQATVLVEALAQTAWPKWLTSEQSAAVAGALSRAHGETDGADLVERIVDKLSLLGHFEYRRILEAGNNSIKGQEE